MAMGELFFSIPDSSIRHILIFQTGFENPFFRFVTSDNIWSFSAFFPNILIVESWPGNFITWQFGNINYIQSHLRLMVNFAMIGIFFGLPWSRKKQFPNHHPIKLDIGNKCSGNVDRVDSVLRSNLEKGWNYPYKFLKKESKWWGFGSIPQYQV